jgi:hypothetical protein
MAAVPALYRAIPWLGKMAAHDEQDEPERSVPLRQREEI